MVHVYQGKSSTLAVEGGSKEFAAKFVMESDARTGNIEGTKARQVTTKSRRAHYN